MKKSTAHAYESKAHQRPMVATMATEGRQRMQMWMVTGCNAFEGKRPMGKPMSFWTEQDVLHFLVERQIPYCSVYGDIVASDGENDYDATLVEDGGMAFDSFRLEAAKERARMDLVREAERLGAFVESVEQYAGKSYVKTELTVMVPQMREVNRNED